MANRTTSKKKDNDVATNPIDMQSIAESLERSRELLAAQQALEEQLKSQISLVKVHQQQTEQTIKENQSKLKRLQEDHHTLKAELKAKTQLLKDKEAQYQKQSEAYSALQASAQAQAEAMDTLQNEKAALLQQLTTAQSSLQTLQTEIAETKSTLLDTQKALRSLEDENQKQNEKIQHNKEDIKRLKAEASELHRELDAQKNAFQLLKEAHDKAVLTLEDLTPKLSETSHQLEALNQEKTKLTARVSATVTELAQSRQQILTLQQDNKSQQETLANKQTEITNLLNEIEKLSNRYQTLEGQHKELLTTNEDLRVSLKNTQAKNEHLNQDVQALQTQNKEIAVQQKRIDQLNQQLQNMNQLKAQLKQLQEQLTAQNETEIALRQHIQQYETHLPIIVAENSSYLRQVNELRALNEQYIRQHHLLEEQVKTLQQHKEGRPVPAESIPPLSAYETFLNTLKSTRAFNENATLASLIHQLTLIPQASEEVHEQFTKATETLQSFAQQARQNPSKNAGFFAKPQHDPLMPFFEIILTEGFSLHNSNDQKALVQVLQTPPQMMKEKEGFWNKILGIN